MNLLKSLIDIYLASKQFLIGEHNHFEFPTPNSSNLAEIYIKNHVLTAVLKNTDQIARPVDRLMPGCFHHNQLTNLDNPQLAGSLFEHRFWHRASSEMADGAKKHAHLGHIDRAPMTVDDLMCISAMWRRADIYGFGKCRDGRSECILPDNERNQLVQSYGSYIEKQLDTNIYTRREELNSALHLALFMSFMNTVLNSLVKCYTKKYSFSDTAIQFLTIMTRVLVLACFGASLENIANQIFIEQTLLLLLSIVKLDSKQATLLLMSAMFYQNDSYDFEKLAFNMGASVIGAACAAPIDFLIDHLCNQAPEENIPQLKK